MRKYLTKAVCVFALAALLPAALPVMGAEASAGYLMQGPQGVIYEQSFDVSRFVLPEDAAVLVVVEGTFGTECKVHAYEKTEKVWTKRFETDGWLGYGGLSNNRTMGDRTTPIGLFQLNTPFGQAKAEEGFPADYIRVDAGYVWEDDTNRLSRDLSKSGERVGSAGYLPQYVYVLDMGYNKNAVKNKGSALFIHCKEENEDGTLGCVAIEKSRMAEIMRLYGSYGDGKCYIALAPFGTFDKVYESLGVNNGLSPEGDFSEISQPPAVPGPFGLRR